MKKKYFCKTKDSKVAFMHKDLYKLVKNEKKRLENKYKCFIPMTYAQKELARRLK